LEEKLELAKKDTASVDE